VIRDARIAGTARRGADCHGPQEATDNRRDRYDGSPSLVSRVADGHEQTGEHAGRSAQHGQRDRLDEDCPRI
jgi:hypothetical protein